ncbi:glycosyltransferase family 39 protein [Patulibacter brassicae]|uniref:Glycosyltransferase family 39 protein n=1 Tax=Patulibacter brassicae TaxID=1705717 RepID=A0ABU4VG99_9ACTN|nr:glycosyltransferase family 39 protein [Patulibacter brassicae]MDX8150818.1 glycosyltransferase family 39 protein [Patulibacter brassicae]
MTLPGRLRGAPGRTAERARTGARGLARRPELLGLLLLAGVLNLWALDQNGMANEYYSAAVRSMTESWHAFLYGSFDSAGVMTVDKPPLALWIQALSARAFGLSAWSILVPQALMGVATVGLAYDLVARRFGRPAGTAAGLALALTPIAVAVSRHNNPDALLVLCATLALWATLRGLEQGRTRWLVLAGVAVGLGFEAKMAAALMVVPGIVAAWLWIAPTGRLRAVRQVGAFGLSAAVVGLAWPILVWLTPATDRPWVSGTSDNSIWSLIFGYNGLGRLFGQSGGPGGMAGGGMGGGPMGGGGGGGLSSGGTFGGDPGVLRLLNQALGGQAGWLLGAAIVAGLGLLVATRLRRDDARTGFLLVVGGAGLVTAVAFSRAEGIFHPYYVSLIAPFVAALVGAGVGTAWPGRATVALAPSAATSAASAGTAAVAGRPSSAPAEAEASPGHRGGRAATAIHEALLGPRLRAERAAATAGASAPAAGRPTPGASPASRGELPARVLGPALLLGGLVTELVVLRHSATDLGWWEVPLIVGTLAVAGVLASGLAPRIRRWALAVGVALLLVAPGSWSFATLGHATSGTFPAGGPASSGMDRFRGGPGGRMGGPGGAMGGGPGGMPGAGPASGQAGGPPAMPGASSSASGRSGGPPAMPGASGSSATGRSGGASAVPGRGTSGSGGSSASRGGGMGGPGGGGMFGGNTRSLSAAVTYAAAHGGGTVAVSSQSGAASSILAADGNSPVVAIGGFSGRESQVSVAWLADMVEAGKIRWVVADSDGLGGMRDGRVGASDVLAVVQQVGKEVSSVDGLYDLQGLASALRAAG